MGEGINVYTDIVIIEMTLHWMECKSVNGPYVIDVVDSLTMTFESVFLFLSSRARIEILDCYPTFRRSRCIPCVMVNQIGRGIEIHAPWPSTIHANDLVINFKLLSLSCTGASICLISKILKSLLAMATTSILSTRSI